ncbi:MAG: HAMP domain-containing histidine kinase [Bacteroidetes bacterium]|nr:HAMP domain-containing histidine kinase [Bacteroidota bacterium]
MKLRTRVAFIVGIFVSVLLGFISISIYLDFAGFRREESEFRLKERAETTIKLLIEVKEIDNQILKLIDKHRVNKIYNEKTLVFNDSFQLIYSSMDDAVINWKKSDLSILKNGGYFFRSQAEYDVLGSSYILDGREYYVINSVDDRFGIRKLKYLGNVLLVSSIIGITVIWVFIFFVIRKMLKPLDNFQEKITEITEKQLTIRLTETGKNDEIDLMAHAFNQMMLRIENAYARQRDFTSNASHELRTPLARILSQLENLNLMPETNADVKQYVNAISDEVSSMVDTVNSLLLFSRIEQFDKLNFNEIVRLDQIIFDILDEIKLANSDFSAGFSIAGDTVSQDEKLELKANASLLKIALGNLFMNAYQYSENKKVLIELDLNQSKSVLIRILNDGQVLDFEDISKIFLPFSRGKNTIGKQGSGLGLSIAKSIIHLHNGEINYQVVNNLNLMEVKFLSQF